ncbi:unnamed protein product [Amoebophrya sp. A120]|nr:unnamed protein product [Amoebophrya sp. A120]|eukprot:GSA120T00018767001.1
MVFGTGTSRHFSSFAAQQVFGGGTVPPTPTALGENSPSLPEHQNENHLEFKNLGPGNPNFFQPDDHDPLFPNRMADKAALQMPVLGLDAGTLKPLTKMMKKGERIDVETLVSNGGAKALETLSSARLMGQLDHSMLARLGPDILRKTAREAAWNVLKNVPGLTEEGKQEVMDEFDEYDAQTREETDPFVTELDSALKVLNKARREQEEEGAGTAAKDAVLGKRSATEAADGSIAAARPSTKAKKPVVGNEEQQDARSDEPDANEKASARKANKRKKAKHRGANGQHHPDTGSKGRARKRKPPSLALQEQRQDNGPMQLNVTQFLDIGLQVKQPTSRTTSFAANEAPAAAGPTPPTPADATKAKPPPAAKPKPPPDADKAKEKTASGPLANWHNFFAHFKDTLALLNPVGLMSIMSSSSHKAAAQDAAAQQAASGSTAKQQPGGDQQYNHNQHHGHHKHHAAAQRKSDEIDKEAVEDVKRDFAPVEMKMNPERAKLEYKLDHPKPVPEPGKSVNQQAAEQDAEEHADEMEEEEAEGETPGVPKPSAKSLAAPALKKYEELRLTAAEISAIRDRGDFPDPHTVDVAMKSINMYDRAVPVHETVKQACTAYAKARNEIHQLAGSCRALEATFIRKTDPQLLKDGIIHGCGESVLDVDEDCEEPADELACRAFETFVKKVDAQVLETCNGELTLDERGKTETPLVPMDLDTMISEPDDESAGGTNAATASSMA